MLDKIVMHARTIEFDRANLLAMLSYQVTGIHNAVQYKTLVFNPFTPRSDQHINSPYKLNTLTKQTGIEN